MASPACEDLNDRDKVLALERKVELLEHQVDWFKRQLFGRKSEKRLVEDRPEQPLLEGLVSQAPAAAETDTPTETLTYTRRKQRAESDVTDAGLRFDETVPVETIHCPAPALAGGAEAYEQISEKVSYRLAQRPGSYVVLAYVRPVYKHTASGALASTPAPPGLWPGSVADVSVVAGLLVEKFLYHQPLYRQHQRLQREGITLARPTLSTWVHKAIGLLEPIYDALHRRVLQSKVLAIDETPIKAGREKRGKMRVAWYGPLYGDEDEVVFSYSRTRGHQHLLATLTGFQGTLLTDGHGAYRRYAGQCEGLVHAQCWAHTRREFLRAKNRLIRCRACCASQISLAASACIQILTFVLNALTKVGIAQVVFGNQIDRAFEEAFQPFLQREKGLRVLCWLKIFELDQEIQIAVLGVKIVPGC